MAGLKKVTLDNQTQEALWSLLHDQNEVIADVLGTEVKLTVLAKLADHADTDDIVAEIESDPELKAMLLASDEDIKAGRVYTAEEAIQYLKDYHSK
ncbi:hypothetical protein ACE41H_16985 [Paenibacillus enshidis]|uniref:Uncharacterized protein n=1 Tax=Paenibacillus enshidis TaxID=1458439 RepID=A0ABV5AX38_9BACL